MHIILATLNNDLPLLTQLLTQGGNPNETEDEARLTPLHHAASNGYYKVSLLLLTAGAKLSQERIWGETPLGIARKNRRSKLIKLLSRVGPSCMKTKH